MSVDKHTTPAFSTELIAERLGRLIATAHETGEVVALHVETLLPDGTTVRSAVIIQPLVPAAPVKVQ